METPAPVTVELPPPESQASLLAFYLEGISLIQIARVLKVSIGEILDFLRDPAVRECIEQYEECLIQQTRLCAQASRIPAMTTLREVCVTQGPLAERRRAAADLLRQSRAAAQPAKGKRLGRTAHSTPTPEKFIPDPNVQWPPEIPLHSRPLEPYELTLDLKAPAPSHATAPKTTDAPMSSSALDESIEPIEPIEPRVQTPSDTNIQSAPKTQGSFTAHEHTASWHAFDRDDANSSAPSQACAQTATTNSEADPEVILESSPEAIQATALNAPAVAHVQGSEQLPAPQSPEPLLIAQPPTRIPSPYDSICAPEISTPLPDAVPLPTPIAA